MSSLSLLDEANTETLVIIKKEEDMLSPPHSVIAVKLQR